MRSLVLSRMFDLLDQTYGIDIDREEFVGERASLHEIDAVLAFKSDPHLDELRGAWNVSMTARTASASVARWTSTSDSWTKSLPAGFARNVKRSTTGRRRRAWRLTCSASRAVVWCDRSSRHKPTPLSTPVASPACAASGSSARNGPPRSSLCHILNRNDEKGPRFFRSLEHEGVVVGLHARPPDQKRRPQRCVDSRPEERRADI